MFGTRAGSSFAHMSSTSPLVMESTLKKPQCTSGLVGVVRFVATILGNVIMLLDSRTSISTFGFFSLYALKTSCGTMPWFEPAQMKKVILASRVCALSAAVLSASVAAAARRWAIIVDPLLLRVVRRGVGSDHANTRQSPREASTRPRQRAHAMCDCALRFFSRRAWRT